MDKTIATLPIAAPILNVEIDNYRTRTYTLDARLDAYPGQFVMLWLPGFDEKPFSLVGSDPVRLMITEVGPFTQLIHAKQPGDLLWVRGPFGHGFSPKKDARNVLLVGGGYGVAPLLWLAQRLGDGASRVTAIIGARTARELLYVDRFRALADDHTSTAYHVLVATDDGSAGQQGLVTDLAAPTMAAGDIDGMYACGPHAMLAALRALARSEGVACQLSWEAYMRCGMGLCGACELEGELLCLDGPVVGVGT